MVLVVGLGLAHWVWVQSQTLPLGQVLTQLRAQAPDGVRVLKQHQALVQVLEPHQAPE